MRPVGTQGTVFLLFNFVSYGAVELKIPIDHLSRLSSSGIECYARVAPFILGKDSLNLYCCYFRITKIKDYCSFRVTLSHSKQGFASAASLFKCSKGSKTRRTKSILIMQKNVITLYIICSSPDRNNLYLTFSRR